MKKLLIVLVVILVVLIVGALAWNAIENRRPKPGTLDDEALAAGRDAASFPAADEDYFRDMDYGASHDPEALRTALDPFVPGITADQALKAVVKGRNNWIVWSAGNDRLWDELSRASVGALDLLKTLSSHPSLGHGRHNRWQYMGLVNEPCFSKATGPRDDRHGLWLDVRDGDCPPDPFENEKKYPGVETGARGENLPAGSFYGYATGVVGLRLFPNPAFDEAAEETWDPERYYDDPDYYNDRSLVKPYRVGMSCGFCHVGPNPTRPPADPENPTWAELNSNPGAQYFWIDRVFFWDHDNTASFAYQLFHTSRPGALDTSLVSSDQINNPRTMNAIYELPARMAIARQWGQETLADGGLDNAQFNDYVPAGSPLDDFYEAPNTVFTPRVLKDGADSVGALGALNRVFVNIGLFSEEWLLHFIPLLGGPEITAFPIETARQRSSMWNATEQQTPDLALFFLATAKPDRLADADAATGDDAEATAAASPWPETAIDPDALPAVTLGDGQRAFAHTCARCHSSKLPQKAFDDFFPDGCVGEGYLECWNDYWQWTKTDEFKEAMEKVVGSPDFLDGNFLSTELRVPVTLLETNACSPLATNAIAGNIWNDFSSQSYKSLPSVGTIQVHHPYSGEVRDYEMPAGGRGYTRPASLVSLWSTAPYLQNNTVGEFEWSGSVEGRLASFDDGIRKMLWPETREGDEQYMTRSGKPLPGVIDGTTETSYLEVPAGFLPHQLAALSGPLDRFLPNVFATGGVKIGPIPAGTPINLLSNLDLEKKREVIRLALEIKRKLKKLPADASDDEARKVFAPLVPSLLAASKCPDFVVNRGHYFGTEYLPAHEGETALTDGEKEALIAFLKTF